MTDWFDPLVIATLGLVTATAGLFVATAFYAKYTKRQVVLLQSQEKIQIDQNRVLKANIEMMKLVTQSQFRSNPNWFDQEAERVLSELKRLETGEPIIGSNSTPASKPYRRPVPPSSSEHPVSPSLLYSLAYSSSITTLREWCHRSTPHTPTG